MNSAGKYLSFFLPALLFWQCSDDPGPNVQSDATYFPLTVGAFYIYDVEETQYSVINGQEDLNYQLKLAVTDSFRNNAGGTTYVVQRYVRDNMGEEFQYTDTWSARVEASQVVVAEGNISYVRLVFPISEGRSWNGNALNNLKGDEPCGDNTNFNCDLYQIESIGTPYQFNEELLTETVEVVQSNNIDVIVKEDVRKEFYARNIGLVYKESSVLNYCTVGSCIGQQQIDDGYTWKQSLVEYGKE